MTNDILSFPMSFDPLLKILFLIILAIYVIFAIILFNRTLSLGNIILIKTQGTTTLLNLLTLLHLLAAVLLFLGGIVIL